MKQNRLILLIWGIVLVIALLVGSYFLARKYVENKQNRDFIYSDRDITIPVTEITPSLEESDLPSPMSSSEPTVSPSSSPLPTVTPTPLSRVNYDVPFTVQAPTGNWDEVHEETCEESALLMAQWWAMGKKGEVADGYANRIPPSVAESTLQSVVDWENATFGYYKDTTAAESARIAKEKLGLTHVTVSTNVTELALKKALNEGNILVVPTAGQLLNNPYFKQPGPPYHMIVVRGYNDSGFIANDPGTRRGEGYVYSYTTLINAIHDWNGQASTIQSGKKVVLIIGKQ